MKIKNSLRYKILFPFSAVILTAFVLLVFISGKVFRDSDEYIIKKEMIETKKDMDIYIKQYFTMNNIYVSKASFKHESSYISTDLSYKVGNKVILYDTKGRSIIKSTNKYLNANTKDLKEAVKGKISYRINYFDNKVIVNLSYPVIYQNSTIGILRYSKDYTELYEVSSKFQMTLRISILILFIFILSAAYFISVYITKPVMEVANKALEAANGNLDVNMEVKSEDEIGKLAKSFKYMVKKVKKQIDIIKIDRDKLLVMEKERKIFFDNATHELKTPITTILGYAEIIKENGFSDKDFFERGTSRIILEGQRLNRMVIELLEFSKTNSENFRFEFNEFKLTELINSTCSEMSLRAGKYNIHIEAVSDKNILFYGDKDRIKEVLINLIDNSIKYGNVNSVVEVVCWKDEENIYIQVKDKGEGIPEEHLKDIFQPFYRVSKKRSRELGSNGLGLAICKAIVERHSGTIDIESEFNQGTTVTVRFNANIEGDKDSESI